MINVGIIVGHGNTGCAFIDGPTPQRFWRFGENTLEDLGDNIHFMCVKYIVNYEQDFIHFLLYL